MCVCVCVCVCARACLCLCGSQGIATAIGVPMVCCGCYLWLVSLIVLVSVSILCVLTVGVSGHQTSVRLPCFFRVCDALTHLSLGSWVSHCWMCFPVCSLVYLPAASKSLPMPTSVLWIIVCLMCVSVSQHAYMSSKKYVSITYVCLCRIPVTVVAVFEHVLAGSSGLCLFHVQVWGKGADSSFGRWGLLGASGFGV